MYLKDRKTPILGGFGVWHSDGFHGVVLRTNMLGEDHFHSPETLMGRRKGTGYVAAKIRANTARRNGNLQWQNYPRAPLLYTTFAREDLVLDKVGTNSFNVYENGEWSGNITVSMAGITARDIGLRGSGTAQWVFPEVQERGKAFAANQLTGVVLALLMDYPFKSAVEGYGGGLLRVSR